ncbi:MAG TPA: hypothetical protein PKA63_07020 [Oligoflexia bacterium]|nr:hypothetical protein [Oligoflexia bacterium]HMP48402.1 hypothetical protein [Oligoflexia bacterium]
MGKRLPVPRSRLYEMWCKEVENRVGLVMLSKGAGELQRAALGNFLIWVSEKINSSGYANQNEHSLNTADFDFDSRLTGFDLTGLVTEYLRGRSEKLGKGSFATMLANLKKGLEFLVANGNVKLYLDRICNPNSTSIHFPLIESYIATIQSDKLKVVSRHRLKVWMALAIGVSSELLIEQFKAFLESNGEENLVSINALPKVERSAAIESLPDNNLLKRICGLSMDSINSACDQCRDSKGNPDKQIRSTVKSFCKWLNAENLFVSFDLVIPEKKAGARRKMNAGSGKKKIPERIKKEQGMVPSIGEIVISDSNKLKAEPVIFVCQDELVSPEPVESDQVSSLPTKGSVEDQSQISDLSSSFRPLFKTCEAVPFFIKERRYYCTDSAIELGDLLDTRASGVREFIQVRNCLFGAFLKKARIRCSYFSQKDNIDQSYYVRPGFFQCLYLRFEEVEECLYADRLFGLPFVFPSPLKRVVEKYFFLLEDLGLLVGTKQSSDSLFFKGLDGGLMTRDEFSGPFKKSFTFYHLRSELILELLLECDWTIEAVIKLSMSDWTKVCESPKSLIQLGGQVEKKGKSKADNQRILLEAYRAQFDGPIVSLRAKLLMKEFLTFATLHEDRNEPLIRADNDDLLFY